MRAARAPSLEELQEVVGGPIEKLIGFNSYNGERVVALCNEDGRLKGLPRNEQATLAWAACKPFGGWAPQLYGPVLVLFGTPGFMAAL